MVCSAIIWGPGRCRQVTDVYRDMETHLLEPLRAREEVRACKGSAKVLWGWWEHVACRSKQL